jgi:hypothetical protein
LPERDESLATCDREALLNRGDQTDLEPWIERFRVEFCLSPPVGFDLAVLEAFAAGRFAHVSKRVSIGSATPAEISVHEPEVPRLVLSRDPFRQVGCGSSEKQADRKQTPASTKTSGDAPTDPLPKQANRLAAFSPIVGLSVEKAVQWLKDHPTPCPGNPKVALRASSDSVTEVRPIRIDGEGQVVTDDLRLRVNVIVEHGVITSLDDIY